jgi:uncharacterized membrane protein
MSNANKDVLAVQTLRNSTMAATFLASTAVLLIIGVLNLRLGSGSGNLLQPVDGHYPASTLRLLKLTPLLLDLFGTFFFFSLAIRMYNHVGYLINTAGHPSFSVNPAYVTRLLNRGGKYYSFGMRSYYLSIPFVFWLFGPAFLFAASIGLIVVLHHLDRSPQDAPTPEEQLSTKAPPTETLAPALRFLRDRAA